MEPSRRSSSEDYIDPHVLELPSAVEYTGAWMEADHDEAASPREASFEDDVLAWDLRLESERSHPVELATTPSQVAAPPILLGPQPDAAVRSSLRPQAVPFRPQPTQRPQLQLATSEAHLQPSNPEYLQPAPRSAPDIRVHEPDAFPPIHYPSSAAPMTAGRRRAVSYATPPTLRHLVTAPAVPSSRPDAFLSPVQAERMISDEPYYPVGSLSAPTSPRTPERYSRGSRSPSRSRSHSRSSSIASSARSSATGEYACQHPGCESRFKTKSKLNHHKRYHTPQDERPYSCDQCDARFLFKRELTRHKLSKTHQPQQFACPQCGTYFSRQDHVDRHLERGSCPQQRLTTPVTPISTSMPQSSAPSTTGSSYGDRSQPYGSAEHLRFDTPFTEADTPSHPNSNFNQPFYARTADPLSFNCDPMVVPDAQPWSPSPSAAANAYTYGPYITGPQHYHQSYNGQ